VPGVLFRGVGRGGLGRRLGALALRPTRVVSGQSVPGGSAAGKTQAPSEVFWSAVESLKQPCSNRGVPTGRRRRVDDLDQGSGVARGVDESGAGLALCRPEHLTVQSLATVPTERYSARHLGMGRPKDGHQHCRETLSLVPST